MTGLILFLFPSTNPPLRHYVLSCTLQSVSRVITWILVLIRPDRDAMDYFRAIVKAGERSHRGLELTDHLINLNPAHYSVWCASHFPRTSHLTLAQAISLGNPSRS